WTTGCICYACPVHNPAQVIWRQQVPAQPPIITAVQPAKTKIIKRNQGTIMKKYVNKSSTSTVKVKKQPATQSMDTESIQMMVIKQSVPIPPRYANTPTPEMIKSDICQIQQKILVTNDEDEKQGLQMHTGNLERQLATMLKI
uniref:Uncharacterized protein n=1 Tax=Romanomermis culicivorax TaxID=13658 RepID=A0A915KTZ1_ROMCU